MYYLEKQLDNFWSLSSADACKSLSTSALGLSGTEPEDRLRMYGPNTLKTNKNSSSLILFLSQFKSPITILLMAAVLLSMALGEFTDATIILIIVIISSFLGFWQEKGAAHAIDELLKMVQIRCRVIRDGISQDLPIDKLVSGDITILSAGDIIPGDCLLIESQEVFVDEAAFTGETFPGGKEYRCACGRYPAVEKKQHFIHGFACYQRKSKGT